MNYILYGIPNCDTVKKARKHLEGKGAEYSFVNFKKTPPTLEQLKRWKSFFEDYSVNKKGRTFKLIQDEWEKANSAQKYQLLMEHTSAIKRPILEREDLKVLFMGYDEAYYNGIS